MNRQFFVKLFDVSDLSSHNCVNRRRWLVHTREGERKKKEKSHFGLINLKWSLDVLDILSYNDVNEIRTMYEFV